jgi:conjugative relaxase-like TrwC/TraI family protein
MLNIAKRYQRSWRYYAKSEIKYESIEGFWLGELANEFSLDNLLDKNQIYSLFHSRNPSTNSPLNSTKRAIAVYDLVFSAPKEISLLALAENDKELNSIGRTAHQRAIKATFNYLEAVLSVARQSKNKQPRLVKTKGLLALGINHKLSRMADPHLHTHLLIANLTTKDYTKYTGLISTLIYSTRTTASMVYRDYLLKELRQGLVLKDNIKLNNLGLYDSVILNAFSKRHFQIQSELKSWPHSPTWKVKEVAFLKSRPAKQSHELNGLKNTWVNTMTRYLKPNNKIISRVNPVKELDDVKKEINLTPDLERLSEKTLKKLENLFNGNLSAINQKELSEPFELDNSINLQSIELDFF